MPTTSLTKTFAGVRRLASRFGAQAAIVAVGAGLAIGTVEHAAFLPHPDMAQQPFAHVLSSSSSSPTPTPTQLTPGFSVGIDHPRVTYWIDRLTSSLKTRFEKTLARKSEFESMISTKLDA